MTITELEQQRAERKEELDLPISWSLRQVVEYVAATGLLDGRLTTAHIAAANLAALGTGEADQRWLDFLNASRATLCNELLAIKSPIRDRDTKERSDALTFSIRLIDFGFGAAKLPVVTLAPTPLGALMIAAGYQTSGEDLHGPSGWLGSLPETEQRIKSHARQRAEAQAALDDALLDDAERAKRDAAADARRAVLEGLRLTGSDGRNGQPYHLVPHRADGSVVERSELTPEQRDALDRVNAAEAAREAARWIEMS